MIAIITYKTPPHFRGEPKTGKDWQLPYLI